MGIESAVHSLVLMSLNTLNECDWITHHYEPFSNQTGLHLHDFTMESSCLLQLK